MIFRYYLKKLSFLAVHTSAERPLRGGTKIKHRFRLYAVDDIGLELTSVKPHIDDMTFIYSILLYLINLNFLKYSLLHLIFQNNI